MAGDFEIFDAKNTDELLTISGRNVFLPEMSIDRAIVLEKEFAEGDECPMPHCAGVHSWLLLIVEWPQSFTEDWRI